MLIVKILIAVAVVLALLAGFIATRPEDFRITRSAAMSAPAAAAFAQVNDFHNWAAWSPWEKLDPDLKRTFEGAPAGTGAVYSWDGNKQVGAGRMTMLESRPGEVIRLKLEFFRPFAATNGTEFAFQPEGNQTRVTWTMDGKNTFITKAFHLVMNMDKVVGGDFEKGLAQMKSIVEAAPRR